MESGECVARLPAVVNVATLLVMASNSGSSECEATLLEMVSSLLIT